MPHAGTDGHGRSWYCSRTGNNTISFQWLTHVRLHIYFVSCRNVCFGWNTWNSSLTWMLCAIILLSLAIAIWQLWETIYMCMLWQLCYLTEENYAFISVISNLSLRIRTIFCRANNNQHPPDCVFLIGSGSLYGYCVASARCSYAMWWWRK